MRKRLIDIAAVFAALLLPATARAQFYLNGNDPASRRWMQMDSPHYKLIYPVGMDSLARVYGVQLETWRNAVGKSAGYAPCEFGRKRLPVLLHADHAVSNGMVVWAPSRMELYTAPDMDNPIPIPWEKNLAIHEQRHVAQMQTGLTGPLRPIGWFFGEMLNGAACAAYGGNMWMEGDAVIAETALTNSGRGRMDSFLNYYMVSFDSGDWRNWYSWSNGSQRRYTPDHYALGYMLLAGVRYNYNFPELSAGRFGSFSRNPFRWGYTSYLKKVTGKKIQPLFQESAGTFYSIWKEEADARAPYMESLQIVDRPSRHTEFSDIAYSPLGLFAVRQGMQNTPQLVRIRDNGKARVVKPFSYTAGGVQLDASGDGLIWHEIIGDPRWELKSSSKIRRYDIATGRVRTIGRGGMYFNPTAGPDSSVLVTVSEMGRTALGILHSGSKKAQIIATAPDGVQVVQSCEFEGDIYASAVSGEGFGIYIADNGSLRCILGPQPVSMGDFGVEPDGHIHFSSDLNGITEYYHFNPRNGELHRLTSTRYGVSDCHFSPDGRSLVYSSPSKYGSLVYKTPVDSLLFKRSNFSNPHRWVIADELSRQEAGLGACPEDVDSMVFSTPSRYRKFTHALRIHSWAPVWFDYDNITSFSYDKLYELASPGVTLVTQNTLGTLYGFAGYSAHPDPDGGRWRHGGHFKLTWSSWYPVFEAGLDVNDRAAYENGFRAVTSDMKNANIYPFLKRTDRPYVNFTLRSYIPWHFNARGLYSGFIPQLSYSISNDTYSNAPQWYLMYNGRELFAEEDDIKYFYLGTKEGWRFPSQRISASARGYVMLPTAERAVYPRLGIGAETGISFMLQKGGLKTSSGERKIFSPQYYAYVYAYLPGFTRTQGFKLSAKYAIALNPGRIFASSVVNTLPRGLQNNSAAFTALCAKSLNSLALTLDCAIPIWPGDLHIGGFAYLKRIELIPHFDLSFFGDMDSLGNIVLDKTLMSAGCDVNFNFNTLCWVTWPMTVGIRVDWNGGHSFDSIIAGGTKMRHWYVGPLFNISF